MPTISIGWDKVGSNTLNLDAKTIRDLFSIPEGFHVRLDFIQIIIKESASTSGLWTIAADQRSNLRDWVEADVATNEKITRLVRTACIQVTSSVGSIGTDIEPLRNLKIVTEVAQTSGTEFIFTFVYSYVEGGMDFENYNEIGQVSQVDPQRSAGGQYWQTENTWQQVRP